MIQNKESVGLFEVLSEKISHNIMTQYCKYNIANWWRNRMKMLRNGWAT